MVKLKQMFKQLLNVGRYEAFDELVLGYVARLSLPLRLLAVVDCVVAASALT